MLTQNTLFPGSTILAYTFKHLARRFNVALAAMIQITSGDVVLLGDTNLPTQTASGFRLPLGSGGTHILTINDFNYLVTGDNQTVQLPDATSYPNMVVAVMNAPGKTGTTVASAGGQINGASTLSLPAANDSALFQSDGTDWFSIAVTLNTPPVIPATYPKWTKYTIPYANFQGGGGGGDTNERLFATLPAGAVVHAAKIKQSAAFAGGTISAAAVSVGATNPYDDILPFFDVFTAPGGTNFALSGLVNSWDNGATQDINARITVVGGVVNDLTAGSVDIWLLTSVAT